jgi:hypothetical protein
VLKKIAPTSQPRQVSVNSAELLEEKAGLRLVHETELQKKSTAVKKTAQNIIKKMAQQMISEAYFNDQFLKDTTDLIEACNQMTKADLIQMINLQGSFSVPEISSQLRTKLM